MTKAILTCALNGVLTDPEQHAVPVTPAEMAASAREAYDAGASVMHVHYRSQEPGKGRMPTWDPQVACEIVAAIRDACPEVVINSTSGVTGDDYQPALDCLRAVRPEIAACNAGSLNYLKLRKNGEWAWPPMLFNNEVEKIQAYLDVIHEIGALPEMETFDTGIVRSVGLFARNGMLKRPYYNFVTGVASGMPADPDLIPLLLRQIVEGSPWEVTTIGRADVWPMHQRAADLGGMLRTGLEDTFYLPDGTYTKSNGKLIETLAGCARKAGRDIASPAEARQILALGT